MLIMVSQWQTPPAKALAKNKTTVITALIGNAINSESTSLFI